ncbi:MAG: response regulator, partial [Bacteroidota bacterium]
NNILSPILLSLQLLRRKLSDEKDLKFIQMLEDSATRGADLVKQVLAFGRGIEGEKKAIQVRHLANEITKFAQETFPANIVVKNNFPKDVWIINGDATQIHQVLLNLFVNSRDAMPNGGTITLDAENLFVDDHFAKMNMLAKVGPYIIISVTDSGTGMTAEVQEKIFDPFFTTKEMGKGTGLGLSTVFQVVQSHEGFINVYSELGRGTTFKVYLPALQTTETQTAEEKISNVPTGNDELILLVDDETTICEITKLTLETNGYTVITANNGAEAIGIFAGKKTEIQLVLTDMNMPVMDGVALIHAVRTIRNDIKIIAASGLADRKKIDHVKDLNIQAFLPKPFTSETLLEKISEVLKS